MNLYHMARLTYGGNEYDWIEGQWQSNGINRTAFVNRQILGPKGYMKGRGKGNKSDMKGKSKGKDNNDDMNAKGKGNKYDMKGKGKGNAEDDMKCKADNAMCKRDAENDMESKADNAEPRAHACCAAVASFIRVEKADNAEDNMNNAEDAEDNAEDAEVDIEGKGNDNAEVDIEGKVKDNAEDAEDNAEDNMNKDGQQVSSTLGSSSASSSWTPV
jgi:hypothetical protein